MRFAPLALMLPVVGCLEIEEAPAADTFEIESFTTSHARALSGDVVTLSWTYADTEPADQELCLYYLFFDGIGAECFDVDPDQRQTSFYFPSPLRVVLKGATEDGRTSEATLQIQHQEDAYLTAWFTPSHSELPRLGAGEFGVDFLEFVTIEDTDGDGLIDGLSTGQPGTLFNHQTNSSAFRAWNPSPYAAGNNTWGYLQGPWFPAASRVDPYYGFSNLIVYGGSIAVTGGEAQTTKTGDGEEIVWVKGPTLHYEPIFLQMSYQQRGEHIVPTDIQMGNLHQGLVLGITSTDQLGSFGAPHDIYPIDTSEEGIGHDLWTMGYIKGARVTHQVTTSEGYLVNPQVTLDHVEWSMPVHSDTEIGQRISIDLIGD